MKPFIPLLTLLLVLWNCFIFGQAENLDLLNQTYAQENYSEALELAEELISRERDTYVVWKVKGDCLQKMEKFKEALMAYETAAKLNSKSAGLLASWGAAYLNLGMDDQAEAKLKQALKIDDNCAEAYYFLGNLKYINFNTTGALRLYEKAIDRKPDYRDALYMRAAANLELGNHSEALKDYDRVLEIDPNLSLAQLNKAIIMVLNEQYEPALEILSKIDEKEISDKLNLHFYHAEALYYSGSKEEACALYEKNARLGDSDSAEIFERYCLKSEERKEKARKRTIRAAF